MLRLAVPCGNDSSVACHSDMLKHGRGVGHKSGDQFIVPGCPNCHARFTREFLGRDQYSEIWLQAYEQFQTWAWESGHFLIK